MPSNTDNNDFRKPDEGDTDYEVSFNTFFDQIDRAVEIRDTDANRSNYTPKDDAKFFATDTETIYIGDGSNWLKVASSGTNPTFSDAEADTVTITTSITDPSGTTHTGQLADDGDTQPPETHALGGSGHASDTLANLNAKVSDATLDDTTASRPPDSHDNTAHSTNFSPQSHDHSGETIVPNIVTTDLAELNDSATDPTVNGEIRRNGTDIKVYSGGSLRNLSNIGSGGGGGDDSRVQMFARRRITK